MRVNKSEEGNGPMSESCVRSSESLMLFQGVSIPATDEVCQASCLDSLNAPFINVASFTTNARVC